MEIWYCRLILVVIIIVSLTVYIFCCLAPKQFHWSSTQEGWILSAFFIGYLLTQVIGGYLASKFGGRLVFGVGVFMTSVLTLFTLLAAKLHLGVLIGLRVLEGLFEGVTFPAMHALLGRWCPKKERSIMSTIVYTGAIVGNVMSTLISAVLCEYGNWPLVFYVFGSVGIVWTVFWFYIAYSQPEHHPRISQKELQYISVNVHVEDKAAIPWSSMLGSPAVWAIIVASVCNAWGGYTVSICIPLYFKEVHGLSMGKDLIENGLYSAIPFVAFAVLALLSGQLVDCLRYFGVPTVVVRKAATCTSMILAAVGLLSVGYIGSDKTLSVVFLTVSVGFSGLTQAGFIVNHIDLAPQYAGILMGISNTASSLSGILAPIVAKTIARVPALGEGDRSTYQDEWREVFVVSAEVYVFGALVYLILARGEVEKWALGTKERTNSDSKKLTEH